VAEIVAGSNYTRVDLAEVETNIVNVMLTVDRAEAVARTATRCGVLLNATARNTLRLVTHLDISAERARRAAELLAAVIDEVCGDAASH
jgi:threonine aldolase